MSSKTFGQLIQQKAPDVLVTETVYATTYVCPCWTYTPQVYSASLLGSSAMLSLPSKPTPSLASASSSSAAASAITVSPSSSSAAQSSSISSPTSLSTASSAASQATIFVRASTLPDYQTTLLQQHNIHRVNHTAANLTWSASLAATAAEIAASCIYHHIT